ncbi:DUF4123 domain-containing protein [Orbus sturtevantii]|uniref:DUF4123 domain-containing protein n=1 Tax=Orbus sturtevantii TaxID=3074109 RepID=UPI00370D4FE7
MNLMPLLDTQSGPIISAQLKQFGKMHLLIDPKINDDFFFTHQYQFESVIAIRDRQDTVSADHQCLQLCTINKTTSDLDQLIGELKDSDSAAIAIIFSSQSNNALQKHISNAMYMRYQGADYLLRFYDPKVLKHLMAIFKPAQLSQLFGIIEYWYYWDQHYIQLAHKPERVLSDINYQITAKQWQQLTIAQSYNYYENLTIRQQKAVLSAEQQTTLQQLLDWAYRATYNQPDQRNLAVMVNYAMAQPAHFFVVINYDLFAQCINDKTNDIEHYFAPLEKGIEHGITR